MFTVEMEGANLILQMTCDGCHAPMGELKIGDARSRLGASAMVIPAAIEKFNSIPDSEKRETFSCMCASCLVHV